MLRDKSLIPLSHQHQHALALCVRLDRAIQAGDVDLVAWQAEIQQIFQQEIAIHFAAEEEHIFPAAERVPDLTTLVERLRSEHAALREFFQWAGDRSLDQSGLQRFGQMLSTHIRTEERQLFESLQEHLSSHELGVIGANLERELARAAEHCSIPTAATRLRPRS